MRNEKGFSLIEILLAMALVGILGTALPSAVSGAIRATMTCNQRTLAESLARNQMDYIQNQPYDSDNVTPFYAALTDLPEPYNIEMTATRLDPRGNGILSDDGLQQIIVEVKHGTKAVFTLIDLKVKIE